MDSVGIANVIAQALTPLQLILLVLLGGVIYALYLLFKRVADIMDERAKVSEERNKALLNINERFDTYVKEHRHEHNKLDSMIGHLQSDTTELRRESTIIRDGQIRMEAKVDVLVEKYARREI